MIGSVTTYLEDADELSVRDLTVLVEIEVVVDASELLAGEENSELGHEFFKFKLVKSAALISVELLYLSEKVQRC